MRVKDLCKFIEARERHRAMREQVEDPYAHRNRKKMDPIIAKYRFCNVRRNDDRVTKWIHTHWLHDDLWKRMGVTEHLWFAMTVARLFNNEDTLADIGPFVLPFQPGPMRRVLHKRKAEGKKNFNAAYIVSTNGRAMDKIDYLMDVVLRPLWAKRAGIVASTKSATLAQMHELLMAQQGLGSFMAAQVLADLKYAEPGRWKDFDTFAASGPGSKRGLNYLLDRNPEFPMPEIFFRDNLVKVRQEVNRITSLDLTAQDVQNCLCEYSKYYKVQMGHGAPKQLYKAYEKES